MQKILHHMILFVCSEELNITRPEYMCFNDMPRCDQFYIWAVGGKTFYTPNDVGMRVGGKNFDNIILQIHYDNREHLRNQFDSSGALIYTTKHFRKLEGATLTLGFPTGRITIPPKLQKYEINNKCPLSCLKGKIHLFSYGFHAHIIGRELSTEIYRNGSLIDRKVDPEFDFNRQELLVLQPEIIVQQNDLISTTCIYNSMNRQNTTRGGFASSDEMCFNFVFFYPKELGPRVCISNFCINY